MPPDRVGTSGFWNPSAATPPAAECRHPRSARRATRRGLDLLVLIAVVSLASACSSDAGERPLPDDAPRVHFVGLEDGETVAGLVELQFVAENFTIEEVGEGFVHPGAGHFHLGIDADCLPPETLIPTAAPWIHFSDGSDRIELQLTPGRHTLVLQVGDAEHRTLEDPGLCRKISVIATDGDTS